MKVRHVILTADLLHHGTTTPLVAQTQLPTRPHVLPLPWLVKRPAKNLELTARRAEIHSGNVLLTHCAEMKPLVSIHQYPLERTRHIADDCATKLPNLQAEQKTAPGSLTSLDRGRKVISATIDQTRAIYSKLLGWSTRRTSAVGITAAPKSDQPVTVGFIQAGRVLESGMPG